MRPKRAIKLVRKQLKRDPRSLPLRIRLATLLCENGQCDEGGRIFKAVADEYQTAGRLSQAIAVCKSALELDPDQPKMQRTLADLEVKRLEEDSRFKSPQVPVRPVAAAPRNPPSRPVPVESRRSAPSEPPPAANPDATVLGFTPAVITESRLIIESSRPVDAQAKPPVDINAHVDDDYDDDAPTRVAGDHHYQALGVSVPAEDPAGEIGDREQAPPPASLPLRASIQGELVGKGPAGPSAPGPRSGQAPR